MNGEPLVADGHHAAFRRVNATADLRSNMRVGGEAEPVKVDDAMLEVAEAVRPKLVADGMFLVGLDIVGDKLMEVNVFSPGGLGSCETLYKAKFADAVDRRARAQGRAARALPRLAHERESRHAVTSASAEVQPVGGAGRGDVGQAAHPERGHDARRAREHRHQQRDLE